MKIKDTRFYRRLRIIYYKILRAKGTPHSIALAVAIGIFVGCALPPGVHTLFVILLAFIFRTDKIVAFFASWISNPYTIPFMYPFFCYVGSRILNTGHTFAQINSELFHVFASFSLHNAKLVGEELAICFFLGGTIFGLIFGLAGYFITYYLAGKYRAMKEKRRLEKKADRIHAGRHK